MIEDKGTAALIGDGDKGYDPADLKPNFDGINDSSTTTNGSDGSYVAQPNGKPSSVLPIFLLSLGGVGFGYYISIFNPMSIPLFNGIYNYDIKEVHSHQGDANMLFSIGAMLGVLMCGYISDRIGRRTLVVIYDCASIVCVVLHLFKNIWVLQAARLLGGWSFAGAAALVSIVLTEMIPKEISGVGSFFFNTVATSSVFFAYIQQNIFSSDFLITYWRVIFAWPLLIIIPKTILTPYFIKTDTPKYHLSKNYGSPTVESELVEIFALTHPIHEARDRTSELIRLHEASVASTFEQVPPFWQTLLAKDMRKRLLAGLSIGIAQQFSGISYITLYSTDLFNSLNGHGKSATLVVAFAKALGGYLGLLTMRFIGRKKNMVFGLLGQAFSFLLIIIATNMTSSTYAYIGVFTFSLVYATGLGGCFYAYASEVLPPVGVGFVVAVTWGLNSLMGKSIPILADSIGDIYLLGIFTTLCFIFVGILDWTLLETKDKTEEQIINRFREREAKYTPCDYS